MKKSSIGDDEFVIQPQVRFIECPIKTAQGVLGKKWTILIIRDIGLNKIRRFNRLLESISGITPRVLSMRLKELEKEGLSNARKKRNRQCWYHGDLPRKVKIRFLSCCKWLLSAPSGTPMLSLRTKSPGR
jgi:DNA-binding HxlR family transcriptional regulator